MARCKLCNKKLNNLTIIVNTCRCKNVYCREHLVNHNCTYDYKSDFQEINTKNLEKISTNKIEKI
jgi:hypothetical protein